MHKPNNLLELDVKDSLDWDPVVEDLRIVVKADDGHVTLRGTVPSYDDKLRATEDVWTVGGVKAVDNELLVGLVGDVVTDAQMAAACASALDKDALYRRAPSPRPWSRESSRCAGRCGTTISAKRPSTQ
jgi:BON domain-containing protein